MGNQEPPYASFSEPAYSVPETVDYNKLTEDQDDNEAGDLTDLPESDYPEEGAEDDDDSV